MSAAYAILTKNRCVFGGRAGTSLMVCSQTPVSTVTPEAGLAGQLFCKGGDKVMKKAVRKGASKAAALVLSLAMIFGMVPMVGASAEETAGAQDNFDRIVHLDMGRKYFTPEWIESLIDEMAKLGYNQLELDFGNSEAGQLRFALDDMSVTYTYDEYTMVPVDSVSEEEPAAPAETGAPEEEPAAPVSDEVLEQAETNGNGSGVIEYTYINEPVEVTIDLSKALSSESPEGEYITEEQMAEIITYANEKDIEIVPLLNSPGHFGAVLCAADRADKNYRYQRDGKGTNSLNIADPEAQAFGLAVVEKYAEWFRDQGCDTFNIGADEFANDDGTMGFNEFDSTMWSYFDSYVTGLYEMLTRLGYTTVRMFNDGVNYTSYYGKHTSSIPKDIEICYWSCGWDGYDVASADELASLGYSLINTNGDYYFVLKTEKDNTKMQYRSEEECLSFDNGSFMGSGNIGSSAGSMFCIWCDEPDNASQEEIMEAVKGPMTAVAYQMQGGQSGTGVSYEVFKTYGANADVGYTKEEDIYLNVGGTRQVVVDGNVATSTQPDKSVASVETEYTPFSEPRLEAVTSIESGQQYIIANNRAGRKVLTDEDTRTIDNNWPYDDVYGLRLDGTATTESQELWTITGSGNRYTVQNAEDRYLKVGEEDGAASVEGSSQTLQLNYSGGAWTIAQSYTHWYPFVGDIETTSYLYDYGGHGTAAGGWSDSGAATDAGSKWTIYRIVEGQAEDATTITFTGVGEGTTSVIIGDTKYNITVVAEDLSDVDPLTVEYWITNSRVTGKTTGAEEYNIQAVEAYSEQGVAIADLVDEEAIWTWGDVDYDVIFWKISALPFGQHQTGDGGADQTRVGTTITRVRYYEDSWWYYTEDGSWVKPGYNDQLVAYYLQVRNLFPEIDVATKDYGYSPDAVDDGSGGIGLVDLTFGLVMNGQVFPSGSDTINGVASIYPQASTIFHQFDGGRDIGIVSALNNSDYDITKITVTYGNREGDADNFDRWRSIWDENDRIVWDTERTSSGAIWYDETVAWEASKGGNPTIDGLGKYEWKGQPNYHSAILVLFYVEARETEDSLTYQYMLEGESEPFLDYNINITNTAGQPDGTFVNRLEQTSSVQTGTFTLDDGAYVENSSGTRIQILKDLTAINDLNNSPYGSGLYTYSRAHLSDDGKTLTLYYNRAASEHQFVADYGLPLTVNYSSLGIENTGNIQSATASITPNNGVDEVDATTTSVTFTPNNMLSKVVTVTVTLHYTNGTETVSFDVIPASTVYYEAENFVDSDWDTNGTPGNRTQAADKLGDTKNANNYGSDPSYDTNALGSSNDAALMTEVIPSGTGEDTTWPEATFTFTGTGVDIISQTDSTSTWLLVEVKNDNGEPKCAYLVNNYYSAENAGVNTIYQVPVIKVQGLACDTYNVTVKPFYDTNEEPILAVEGQTAEKFNFYLDAIRVYNPLGENGDTYYDRDGEANAQFINLSKYVTSTTGNGLWVDGDPNAVVDPTYKDDGPNNEIYLASGQSVTIKLVDSEGKPIAVTAGKSAQIGARLISGTEAKISVGANSIPVNSTVDQYYEVTGGVDSEITITNTGSGSGIVALTTLKLTDGSN